MFADPAARIFDDSDHSGDERREIVIGYSRRPRLLVVGFTERGWPGSHHHRFGRRGLRHSVMKSTRKAKALAGDLRAEYEFDYSKSRKNHFATGGAPAVAVVLDPDVARVFGSSAKVNRLLRSVIKAVPGAVNGERRRKAG